MNNLRIYKEIVRTIAAKSDKKAIKRFYKEQAYSASFMGHDQCILFWLNNEIVASVIVSFITKDNETPLLHGVVVAKEFRGIGLGQRLVNSLDIHYPLITCFADHSLVEFYTGHGFRKIDLRGIENVKLVNKCIYDRYNLYKQKHKNLVMLIKKSSVSQ